MQEAIAIRAFPHKGVPFAKGTETQIELPPDGNDMAHKGVPFAKGTETKTEKCGPSLTDGLQGCPLSEGD